MKCNRCGFENANNAKFCSNCGSPVIAYQQTQQQSSMEQIPIQQLNYPTYQQIPYQRSIKTKKKSGCLIAILVSLLIVVIFIVIGISLIDDTETDITTTAPTESETTKDHLHDDIVDGDEEITLMIMSEDIAKLYSKYPATTEIDPYSYSFEQEGTKYTVCCTFNCSNPYGVPETHILAIVAKVNKEDGKLHPHSIAIDGIAVTKD